MAVQMKSERQWRKGFVEQTAFKSGVKGCMIKGWETGRWWEISWDVHRK